jgi:hypothetical protein
MKMSCSVLVSWKRYGGDCAAFTREIFNANRLADPVFWSIRRALKFNVDGKTSTLKWNAISMAARHRRHTPPLLAFAKPPGSQKTSQAETTDETDLNLPVLHDRYHRRFRDFLPLTRDAARLATFLS